ncbi:MAG TPA: MraY family glycosyltransferase [Candidatus Cloacimonadota bacterium]|nr:MraY family glycosyltransferase [Candidatus Cloacimonadota bacterium]
MKLGILDKPSPRKIHKEATALSGGFSFAIPILLMQLIFSYLPQGQGFSEQTRKLVIMGFITLMIGLLDDKYVSSARFKLIYQIFLSIVMFFSGFQITTLTNPFGAEFQLGYLSFPITIFWYLLVINALNFIDGLDGLAAGITVIINLLLTVIGIMNHNPFVAFNSVILAAGAFAFLRYNFYPASIFMGDSGSMFLGLNIASISSAGSMQFKGITAMTMLVPIIALFLPLFDIFLAVFRRLKNKTNIFKPDKAHLHHKMLDLGLSQKTVALVAYFITFLFALIAFGFSFSTKKILFMLLIILLVICMIISYLLIRRENHK